MEIKVYEIVNYFNTNYKDKLVETHTIKADTLDECFRKIYSMNRGIRYDNIRRYDFEDKAMEKKYADWVEKNETIGMYYGSATVD